MNPKRFRTAIALVLAAVFGVLISVPSADAQSVKAYDAGGFQLPSFVVSRNVAMVAWLDARELDPATVMQTAQAVHGALPADQPLSSELSLSKLLSDAQAFFAWQQAFTRAGGRGFVAGLYAFQMQDLFTGPPPVFVMLHTDPDTTLESLQAIPGEGPWAEMLVGAYRVAPGWFVLGGGQIGDPPVRRASATHTAMYARVLKQDPGAVLRCVIRPDVLLAPLGDQLELLTVSDPQAQRELEHFRRMKGMLVSASLGTQPKVKSEVHFDQATSAQAYMSDYQQFGWEDTLASIREQGLRVNLTKARALYDTVRPVRDGATVRIEVGTDFLVALTDMISDADLATATVDTGTVTTKKNPFSR